MSERIGRLRATLEGLRWCRMDRRVEALALKHGIDCDVNRKVGLFRETIHLTARGAERRLLLFKADLDSSMQEINRAIGGAS